MLWLSLLDLAQFFRRQDLPPKAPFPTHPALGPIFSGMPCPLSLDRAGPAAASTPLTPLPELLVGPPVPSTKVSAAPTSAPAPPSSQVTVTPSQVVVTPSQGPTVTSQALPNVQDWMKNMKDALLSSMKAQMMDLLGVAPPQVSMGPAVPTLIMGPDALRPLSSSGDRASPWVLHKPGSKRADSSSRSRSPSGDRSLSSRDGQSRRRLHSLSSLSDRLSPPSKRPRRVSLSPQWRLHSPDVSRRGPGPQRHHSSPSHTDPHRSHSPASRRRCRTCPSPSRRPSPAGMTRRPASDVSLSPRRRSHSSLARRSPWGRRTSPRTRRSSHNHRGCSSCSRSSTPCPCRRSRSRSHSPCSQSLSWDRRSRPFAAEQQLLHLRDQSPVTSQEQDQDADLQSFSNDNVMSAEAVRKLFADLVCPPALSHYADPFLDAPVTSNQLVPYVKDSAKSTIVSEAYELNTVDGLFQKCTSFHSLSGDQDKEARTSAYHELTNLMLFQTMVDKQLLNVSSSRPKPEGPFHSHLERKSELGPSTLAVPEQLSNGGGENVVHSTAELGTDFCAPLAPPCGH